MSPPVATVAGRRTWPTTTLLVTVAVLFMLIDGFLGAIQTARFFGDTPSRDNYISAGMAYLTALPAFAAMIWCGRQRGSRRGLWLIGVPAVAMVLAGLNLLATVGDSHDPHPTRAPNPTDLFDSLTVPNWCAVVVFAGVGTATHLVRQRARRAAATPVA